MKLKPKKSDIVAISIWALSFILACKIKPGTRFIWLPDTLLLLGFFPLLIASRARWLWLLFGLGNLFAGFVLEITYLIPADKFQPFEQYHVIEMKHHLDAYHPFIFWMIIGTLCTLVGLVLLTMKLIFWLRKRFGRSKTN